MRFTKAQILEDVAFLAKRQTKAGSFSLGGSGRDTGLSSNSIVSIAYGTMPLAQQEFPSDLDDMQSCERMWKKLPKHRKTGDGLMAMKAARASNYYGKKSKKNI